MIHPKNVKTVIGLFGHPSPTMKFCDRNIPRLRLIPLISVLSVGEGLWNGSRTALHFVSTDNEAFVSLSIPVYSHTSIEECGNTASTGCAQLCLDRWARKIMYLPFLA